MTSGHGESVLIVLPWLVATSLPGFAGFSGRKVRRQATENVVALLFVGARTNIAAMMLILIPVLIETFSRRFW